MDVRTACAIGNQRAARFYEKSLIRPPDPVAPSRS